MPFSISVDVNGSCSESEEHEEQDTSASAVQALHRVCACGQPSRGSEDGEVTSDDRSSFIVSADRIRLAYERSIRGDVGETSSNLVGIFVPPFLVEPILDSHKDVIQQEQDPNQSSCVQWMRSEQEQATLNDVLPRIHGSLIGFSTKGLISVRSSGSNGPVSTYFILIEVPYCEGLDTVSYLMDEVHGQPMLRAYNSVIKLLPLSRISFHCPRSIMQSTNDCKVSGESPVLELPSCPICLHRIDPERLGWPRPKHDQLCSQFCSGDGDTDICDNFRYLVPWPDSFCRACQVIWNHWDAAEGKMSATESNYIGCFKCGLNQTLWVCLTCGLVGCGRYSQAHAKQHNDETGHPYSLELVTQRIWDYSAGEGEFVQRSDLLDCSCMRLKMGRARHTFDAPLNQSISSTPSIPRKDAEGFPKLEDLDFENLNGSFPESVYSYAPRKSLFMDHSDPTPKKTAMVSEEYEALLQSALEDQAQHYEGEIAQLIAALTAQRVDAEKLTDGEASEVNELRREISELSSTADQLGRELLEAQGDEAKLRASSQKLLREQSVSKSLLDKIQEEAKAEHEKGQAQVEELEQQVADLTANLRMREQIQADEELSRAHIFGTTQAPAKKSGKKGKKGRRFGRR